MPNRPNDAGFRRTAQLRRSVSLIALGLIAISFATPVCAEPPAARAKPASEVQLNSRIEITSSATSWDNLSDLFLGNTPAAPFGEGSMFVMRGELRNKGDAPVRYVVLRYELLDAKGIVFLDAEGYNRSAESMRPDEEGHVHPEQFKAIPAGGADSNQKKNNHDKKPQIVSQRVRVAEVHLDTK